MKLEESGVYRVFLVTRVAFYRKQVFDPVAMAVTKQTCLLKCI